MTLFFYQLKQAILSLKQKPGFVLSVITTMGVTLGALLCVMTLTYVMLLKPLPFPDQERLFNIEHRLMNSGAVDGQAFTYPNLMHLYQHQIEFEQSALVYFDGAVVTSLSTEPMAEISFVTPEWFSLLDTKLAIGRAFEKSEKVNSYHPVAMISFEMWQEHYAGSADVLSQSLSFGGKSYQIVGVVAKDNVELPLAGPGFKTKIYIPWDFNSVSERDRKMWGNDDSGLMFIGKIKATSIDVKGTSQLDQSLTNLVNDNWRMHVANEEFFKGWSIELVSTPLKSYIVANNEKSLVFLLIGAFGLVSIACANIANLLVSRTSERQQQLAICAAVGANRKQLFGSILAEIGLLLLFSLIVAQIVAMIGFSTLEHFLQDYLPRIEELSLNQFSLISSVIILILLTLFFSLLCRRTINFRALNTTLQSSGKGNGVQVSKKVRQLLMTSQIAVATTLIFINIVLYKDANDLANQALGYQTENINFAVLALPNTERSIREESLTQLKKALLASPKVLAVSQALRPSGFGTFALITEADNQRFSIAGKDIDHQYFSLIDQKIIEGDNFTESQVRDNEQVMIINQAFAKKLAPSGSAIGVRFNNGARVVGVVSNINIPGRISTSPRFYFPTSLARNMLLIKLNDNQSMPREELLQTMKSVNRNLSLFSYDSLTQYKNKYLFSTHATAVTTIALTIITFLLSGLGLYGVLNYATSMRRFEIGTRLAIGAKKKDIIKLIIKDNSGSFISGIVISTLILAVTYYLLHDKIGGYVSLSSIILFASTLLIIAAVCVVACYVPLRRYITQPAIKCLRGSD